MSRRGAPPADRSPEGLAVGFTPVPPVLPVLLATAALGWWFGSRRNHPDAPGTTDLVPTPVAGAASPADQSRESSVERWTRVATSVIAPTTLLTALLFYFGYVETTAEYRYFGITIGTLELTTQDLVLRSIGALYVPLGGLLALLIAMSWIHGAVSRRLSSGGSSRSLRRLGAALVILGAAGVVRGVIGVLVPEVARTEAVALSPLSLALGSMAAAYGTQLWRRASGRADDDRGTVWSRRASLALTAGLVTLSLFWATNSFAAAYGRGRALEAAARLEDRPRVTLDTTERLFLVSSGDSLGVVETPLAPVEAGQRFRYRYTGLRLLVEAQGRLFLLPERWNIDTGYTLVINVGNDLRFLVYR